MTEQTTLDTETDRAAAAEDLLREFLEITGVAHKHPAAGGHDTIGVDSTCAGCELAGRVGRFLEAGR